MFTVSLNIICKFMFLIIVLFTEDIQIYNTLINIPCIVRNNNDILYNFCVFISSEIIYTTVHTTNTLISEQK